MQMPSLITTSNWFVSPGEESQQSLDSPWCRFQMGLMTRIFWRGMLRVLPGALSWIKGTCLVSALRGCCQVLLLQLLELQQPVGNMGHHQCSSTASHPQWPHRWPKCHYPLSVQPCSGRHSTEPVVRVGICIALSHRFLPEVGSVTCGLIPVVQRDLFAEDARLQPPTLSGSLLFALQLPPSHQHHLLPLPRNLTQLFPQYGLWSQMIPTWQLSWRGWWKSGKEIHW